MNTNTSLLNSSEDELKAEINKKQNGPIAFKLMTSMRKHSEKSNESKETFTTNYTYECNKDYILDGLNEMSSFELDNNDEDNSFRSSINNDEVSTENILIYSNELNYDINL